MGKKVSVIEGLAFMLIVNAAKGSILTPQCAKDIDEVSLPQLNNFKFNNVILFY